MLFIIVWVLFMEAFAVYDRTTKKPATYKKSAKRKGIEADGFKRSRDENGNKINHQSSTNMVGEVQKEYFREGTNARNSIRKASSDVQKQIDGEISDNIRKEKTAIDIKHSTQFKGLHLDNQVGKQGNPGGMVNIQVQKSGAQGAKSTSFTSVKVSEDTSADLVADLTSKSAHRHQEIVVISSPINRNSDNENSAGSGPENQPPTSTKKGNKNRKDAKPRG